MTETLTADIDGHAEEIGQELDRRPVSLSALYGTDDPKQIMVHVTDRANALKEWVVSQGLAVRIGSNDHLLVEAWQMLGMLHGCSAVITDDAPTQDNAGKPAWEATAELRDSTGRVIGAGRGMCSRSEGRWKAADDYAVRSMAQTRAVGKAFRSVFGFVAKAAGYNPAPAEEMPREAAPTATAPAARNLKLTKRQQAQLADVLGQYIDAKLPPDRLELKLVEAGVEDTADVETAIAGLDRAKGKALYEWLVREVTEAKA